MCCPYPLSINDSFLAVRCKVISFPRKPTTQLTIEPSENIQFSSVQFSSVQSLSRVLLFEIP